MIDEGLLKVSSHEWPGYAPMADYGAWRVALMNRGPKFAPGGLSRMERHNETDEVFVLLEGRAMLFIAEAADGDAPGEVHSVPMEPSRLYNVRRAAWHACALSADAKVLIVENADTSATNSDYADLDAAARERLAREAAHLDSAGKSEAR